MILRMKGMRYKWIKQAIIPWILLSLFIVPCLWLLPDIPVFARVIATCLWLPWMPLLLLLRMLANANYDPNRQDLDGRIQLGLKLTLTKEQYLSKLKEEIRLAKEGPAEE
jgi:hypothetical protein